MYFIGVPLLIIPLAIYNIMTFLIPVAWDGELTTVRMISGGQWRVSFGDALLALALVLLFFEIVKATRHGQRAIMDHMLSMLVFIAALIEFLVAERAATSTFALLLLICLLDVVGGYSVSIRTAQRDYTVERSDLA